MVLPPDTTGDRVNITRIRIWVCCSCNEAGRDEARKQSEAALAANPRQAVARAALGNVRRAPRLQDLDWRRQHLRLCVRRHLNLPDDVHAAYDASERRETLAVRVAHAAKVE